MKKVLIAVGVVFLFIGTAAAQLTGVIKATLENGAKLEAEFLNEKHDGPFVLGETVTSAKGEWPHFLKDSEELFYVATGSITNITKSTIELNVRSKQLKFNFDEKTRVCNEANKSSIKMLEPHKVVTVTAKFDSEFKPQILTDIQYGYMNFVAASRIKLINPFCVFRE